MVEKHLLLSLILAGAAVITACDTRPREQVVMGPHDGLDLTPVDTGRVSVGDLAPDFSAVSYDGQVVTLSDYRGGKNVVLVFYRGHW